MSKNVRMSRAIEVNLDEGRPPIALRRGDNFLEDAVADELLGHWFVKANLAQEPKVLEPEPEQPKNPNPPKGEEGNNGGKGKK